MAKITITDLNDVLDYGDHLYLTAQQYETELSDSNQQLLLKSYGQKSEAVEAYLSKLNMLQTQIFTMFPAEIVSFGRLVNTYGNQIVGVGFSDKAYTLNDDTGVNKVASILNSDQVTQISEKQEKLQEMLDKATDLLGEDRVDTSTMTKESITALSDSAKQRIETDTAMQEAYKYFTDNLNITKSNFVSYGPIISNARAMTSLDVQRTFDMIQAGHLTVENMELLNSMQDSGDADMVFALASPDKYTKAGKVDPTHVSQEMMSVLYKDLYNGMSIKKGTELKDIEAFLVALSTQNQDAVKIYMEKMVKAGDKLSLVPMAKGMGLIPPFPTQEDIEKNPDALEIYYSQLQKNQPEIANLNEELTKYSYLSSLFESIYAMEFGKKSFTGTSVSEWYVPEKLIVNNQGISFNLTYHYSDYSRGKMDVGVGTKEANIDVSSGSKVPDIGKQMENIKELNKKREGALKDFFVDLGKLGTSFIPGGNASKIASVTLDVLADIAENTNKINFDRATTYSGFANKFNPNETLKTNTDRTLNAINTVKKVYEKNKSISKEIESHKLAANARLFDFGGYQASTDGKVVTAGYQPQYDLQAALTIQDIEQNGFRAHVFREALAKEGYEVKEAQKYLTRFDEDMAKHKDVAFKNDGDGWKLASGQGRRNVTIEKYGVENTWEMFQKVGRKGILGKKDGSEISTDLNSDFDNLIEGRFGVK